MSLKWSDVVDIAILLEEIDLSKSIDYAKAGLINEPKNPELSRIANKSIEKVFIESVPIDGLDVRSSIDTIEDLNLSRLYL